MAEFIVDDFVAFSLRNALIQLFIFFSIIGLALIKVDLGAPAGLAMFAPSPIARVFGVE